jgi:hypothetical protein
MLALDSLAVAVTDAPAERYTHLGFRVRRIVGAESPMGFPVVMHAHSASLPAMGFDGETSAVNTAGALKPHHVGSTVTPHLSASVGTARGRSNVRAVRSLSLYPRLVKDRLRPLCRSAGALLYEASP